MRFRRDGRGRCRWRREGWLLLVAAGLMIAGCPALPVPPSASLAARESVRLAADRAIEVSLGAGAPSRANTVWALYKAEDDSFIFRVRLGPAGEIVHVFDSFVFAQPWLGTEIVPDGRPHPMAFVGGAYVSGGYAAEEGDQVGILGVLHGLLLGNHLGTARLSFYGIWSGDRITGTMVREVEIFAETPFPPPGDAEFSAYAVQEP